jgi:hypothetical protein
MAMATTTYVVATIMDATPMMGNGTTKSNLLFWVVDASACMYCCTIFWVNKYTSNVTSTYVSNIKKHMYLW